MDGESVSAFQVLLSRLDGFASRDPHHCHLLEHGHRDMMRPYLVLPRTLRHGTGYGHGARIPDRPSIP